MSCFKDDGTGFHDRAQKLDEDLAMIKLDELLSQAFQDGMAIDEVMYVVQNHTERALRRSLVQWQLKNSANKNRQ